MKSIVLIIRNLPIYIGRWLLVWVQPVPKRYIYVVLFTLIIIKSWPCDLLHQIRHCWFDTWPSNLWPTRHFFIPFSSYVSLNSCNFSPLFLLKPWMLEQEEIYGNGISYLGHLMHNSNDAIIAAGSLESNELFDEIWWLLDRSPFDHNNWVSKTKYPSNSQNFHFNLFLQFNSSLGILVTFIRFKVTTSVTKNHH